jgi:hypothetical protein
MPFSWPDHGLSLRLVSKSLTAKPFLTMKTVFTQRTLGYLSLLLLLVFPWSCSDHQIDPNAPVTVTCRCQLIDNSGPTPFYDERTLECPGGRYTCKCGGISLRGSIEEFHCND